MPQLNWRQKGNNLQSMEAVLLLNYGAVLRQENETISLDGFKLLESSEGLTAHTHTQRNKFTFALIQTGQIPV